MSAECFHLAVPDVLTLKTCKTDFSSYLCKPTPPHIFSLQMLVTKFSEWVLIYFTARVPEGMRPPPSKGLTSVMLLLLCHLMLSSGPPGSRLGECRQVFHIRGLLGIASMACTSLLHELMCRIDLTRQRYVSWIIFSILLKKKRRLQASLLSPGEHTSLTGGHWCSAMGASLKLYIADEVSELVVLRM